MLNHVPETAVCYHKEGKVHGYQVRLVWRLYQLGERRGVLAVTRRQREDSTSARTRPARGATQGGPVPRRRCQVHGHHPSRAAAGRRISWCVMKDTELEKL